jgi:hypothetical protein
VTNPRGGPTGTDYPAVLLFDDQRHYSWWGVLYPDVTVDTPIQVQTGTVEALNWVPHPGVGEQTCGFPFELDANVLPTVEIIDGTTTRAYLDRDLSKVIEYENSDIHRSFYYLQSQVGFSAEFWFTIWSDQIVKSEAHGLGGIIDFSFQLIWHDYSSRSHARDVDLVKVQFRHEAVIPLAVKNKFALTTEGTVGVNRVKTRVDWAVNDWDPGHIYHGRSLPIRGMLLAREPGVTGDDESNLVAFRVGSQRTKLTAAEWDGEWGAHGVVPEIPDDTSRTVIDLSVPGLLFDLRPDGLRDPCLLPDTGAAGTQGSYGAQRGGSVLHDFTTMEEHQWAIEDWGLRSIHYRERDGTPFNPDRRDAGGNLLIPRGDVQMLHGKIWVASGGQKPNIDLGKDDQWELLHIRNRWFPNEDPPEETSKGDRDAMEDEHPSFSGPITNYLLTRDPLSFAWAFDFMSLSSIWRRWFVDWPAAHRAQGRLANALALVANAMPQFWPRIKSLVESDVFPKTKSTWRGEYVTVEDLKILTASFPYAFKNSQTGELERGNPGLEHRWNISYIGFSDVTSISHNVDPTIIVPTTPVQSELFEANNPMGVYCLLENVGDIVSNPKTFPFNGAHVNGSGEIVLPGVTLQHTGGGYDLTNADVRLVATVWNVPFTVIGGVGLWILAKEVGNADLQALALEVLETVFTNGTYETAGGQHRIPYALHYSDDTDPVFGDIEGTKIPEAHRTEGDANFWRVSIGSGGGWDIWSTGGMMIVRDNSLDAGLVTKVELMIANRLVAGRWDNWEWSSFAAAGKI